MRTKLFGFCLGAIAGLLLLGLIPANAGALDTLKFKLAEPAIIADNSIPAGEYHARPLDTGSDSAVLLLESTSGVRLAVPVWRSDAGNGIAGPHVRLTREDGILRVTWLQFAGESYCYTVVNH